MPYLSSVRLNPMRDKARHALNDPHTIHGMVCHGLPEGDDSDRPLWRIDTDDANLPRLIILTHGKPDWAHIVDQVGWPSRGDTTIVRDYEPLFAQIAKGREFAFRLTANPVQNTINLDRPTAEQDRQRREGRTRGFRVNHRTASHQLAWLLARTSRYGFTVATARTAAPAPGLEIDTTPPPDIRIVKRETRRFRKGRSGRQILLHTATFDGRLTVTDPDALRTALLSGIGPAKSYGCGLLTLAALSGTRP